MVDKEERNREPDNKQSIFFRSGYVISLIAIMKKKKAWKIGNKVFRIDIRALNV